VRKGNVAGGGSGHEKKAGEQAVNSSPLKFRETNARLPQMNQKQEGDSVQKKGRSKLKSDRGRMGYKRQNCVVNLGVMSCGLSVARVGPSFGMENAPRVRNTWINNALMEGGRLYDHAPWALSTHLKNETHKVGVDRTGQGG